MWHFGIDLHRATVVLAAVNDAGKTVEPVTIRCEDTTAIVDAVCKFKNFRAVIEASGTYRWLYDLLHPYGTILLAHPLRLRAMVQRRTKTPPGATLAVRGIAGDCHNPPGPARTLGKMSWRGKEVRGRIVRVRHSWTRKDSPC